MSRFIKVIQYIEDAKSEDDAASMLAALATQIDYRGGRILRAVGDIVPWRVQAFFDNASDIVWLPDGCRRVLCPDYLLK